jgi:hypothetical protein
LRRIAGVAIFWRRAAYDRRVPAITGQLHPDATGDAWPDRRGPAPSPPSSEVTVPRPGAVVGSDREEAVMSSSIEPSRRSSLKRRLAPSAVVFVVTAVGIYATVWLTLGLLRHVVMPVIAVVIAGYLAVQVFRRTSRSP